MGIYWGKDSPLNYSKNLTGNAKTNNQAELMAIDHAVDQITSQQIMTPVMIYSDSKYSIQAIENASVKSYMDTYPNKELIDKIWSKMSNLKNVTLEHIYAHSNRSDKHSYGNRQADKLAYSAALCIN